MAGVPFEPFDDEILHAPLTVESTPPSKVKLPETQDRLRVCVLNSSYEGSDSPMKEYDDLNVGPHHYFKPDDRDFVFDVHPIKKNTAYREVRALAKSGNYDVFYNLCDGSKEEDRAGVEVCAALEEFGVPFTGVLAKWYEMIKPDMKMIAYYNGIATARSAVVESLSEAERKCSELTFPLLIKHPSGWSSVGMTRENKCADMSALLKRLESFLEEFQVALIEEFIFGEEVTVLACADSSVPGGVRVFQPVMITFPEGEDFKHFDLKWIGFDGMEWKPLPKTHPSYEKVLHVAAQSFKTMIGGVGYGRTDIRIDATTGEAYFLEINPQPGMMYPPTQEGSADWIMVLDEDWNHKSFAALQIQEAFRTLAARKPMFYRDFDQKRGYHLRAAQPIAKGEIVLHDEGRAQRLFSRPYIEKHWQEPKDIETWKTSAWPVGRDGHLYAVAEHDPSKWHSYNHSCDPNMTFAPDRSLNCVATRDITKDEKLTMDYKTFMDDVADPFECNCGAATCKKQVVFDKTPVGLLQTPSKTSA